MVSIESKSQPPGVKGSTVIDTNKAGIIRELKRGDGRAKAALQEKLGHRLRDLPEVVRWVGSRGYQEPRATKINYAELSTKSIIPGKEPYYERVHKLMVPQLTDHLNRVVKLARSMTGKENEVFGKDSPLAHHWMLAKTLMDNPDTDTSVSADRIEKYLETAKGYEETAMLLGEVSDLLKDSLGYRDLPPESEQYDPMSPLHSEKGSLKNAAKTALAAATGTVLRAGWNMGALGALTSQIGNVLTPEFVSNALSMATDGVFYLIVPMLGGIRVSTEILRKLRDGRRGDRGLNEVGLQILQSNPTACSELALVLGVDPRSVAIDAKTSQIVTGEKGTRTASQDQTHKIEELDKIRKAYYRDVHRCNEGDLSVIPAYVRSSSQLGGQLRPTQTGAIADTEVLAIFQKKLEKFGIDQINSGTDEERVKLYYEAVREWMRGRFESRLEKIANKKDEELRARLEVAFDRAETLLGPDGDKRKAKKKDLEKTSITYDQIMGTDATTGIQGEIAQFSKLETQIASAESHRKTVSDFMYAYNIEWTGSNAEVKLFISNYNKLISGVEDEVQFSQKNFSKSKVCDLNKEWTELKYRLGSADDKAKPKIKAEIDSVAATVEAEKNRLKTELRPVLDALAALTTIQSSMSISQPEGRAIHTSLTRIESKSNEIRKKLTHDILKVFGQGGDDWGKLMVKVNGMEPPPWTKDDNDKPENQLTLIGAIVEAKLVASQAIKQLTDKESNIVAHFGPRLLVMSDADIYSEVEVAPELKALHIKEDVLIELKSKHNANTRFRGEMLHEVKKLIGYAKENIKTDSDKTDEEYDRKLLMVQWSKARFIKGDLAAVHGSVAEQTKTIEQVTQLFDTEQVKDVVPGEFATSLSELEKGLNTSVGAIRLLRTLFGYDLPASDPALQKYGKDAILSAVIESLLPSPQKYLAEKIADSIPNFYPVGAKQGLVKDPKSSAYTAELDQVFQVIRLMQGEKVPNVAQGVNEQYIQSLNGRTWRPKDFIPLVRAVRQDVFSRIYNGDIYQ